MEDNYTRAQGRAPLINSIAISFEKHQIHSAGSHVAMHMIAS